MSKFEVKIIENSNSNQVPIINLQQNFPQNELRNPELIKIAQNLFRKDGVLQINNLFPKDLVSQLYASFLESYQKYFDDAEYADSLDVGNKRRMITLDIKSAFNDPAVYGNLLLLNMMRRLLDKKFILGTMGVVISLPGSKHQHVHRDHTPLFDLEELDSKLPSYAITAVIPLVDLTEDTGSTRVWKGSHLTPRSQDKERKLEESTVPLMKAGSCYLMDYELLHGGTPNVSNIVRPILYVIYYRSWFRESINFEKQERLLISPFEYQRIPDHYKFLFAGLEKFSQKQEKLDLSKGKFEELDAYNQELRLFNLAKKALVAYGLKDAEIKLIAHRECTTFKIEIPNASQKTESNSPHLTNCFLLRIYRGNYLSPESVESELLWLRSLYQEANLAVPEAVPTLDGKLLNVVEAPGVPEPRICSLTRWVYGYKDKPMNIKAVGILIGKLHNQAANWAIPDNFKRPFWDWDGLFGSGAGYSNDGQKIWELTPEPYRSLFAEVGAKFKEVSDILGQDKEQFGMIHADLCPGNLLIYKDEIRPIDFADCGFGYWGYDIAMFLSYYSQSPEVPTYLQWLLEGYGEVRKFPEEQLQYMDIFIAAQHVTLALWRVNRAQDHPYFRSILDKALAEAGEQAKLLLNR
ncbi:putative homoserine kinase type II (protein kinase fold) [Xenococcus sp. PCC 7305]|uniref:phytanoyl-CoA dioxygenase family protein n=1 Tax=Xenococcus sp. PCC 7305 TaxID=102125 RepID=UPI0002AC7026|nr:phytanoyl-CoA dioxygenase family protein [Xenococcus sp. PCC 7305]ELS00579.1 putative homoserine kinase type II (protein kinase fold) [Xenococcus sp. PCC 7305]